MFNTKIPEVEIETTAEPVVHAEDLVTLAELAAEGFGWNGQFIKSPRDAIEVLARQLDGEVVMDDIGRRCVTRDVARRLLAERSEYERRQAEQLEQRRTAMREQAARNRPRGGKPIPEGAADDITALEVMKADEFDATMTKRRTHLDELLSGEATYHPIAEKEEGYR